MRAAGALPQTAFAGTKTPWPSICVKCDRPISPTYANVKNGHSACKYCAGKATATAAAREILIGKKLIPLEAFPGAKSPWLCKCGICERRVRVVFASAKSGQIGCPYCNKRKIDSAETLKIMSAAQLKPLTPYKSVHTPWTSECLKCHKIVSPTFQKVRLRGRGCVWCARRRMDQTEAIQTMKSANLLPLVPYPGANKGWKSKCLICKRETSPNLSYVAGGGGCKYCGGKAVDPEEAKDFMLQAGFRPLKAYPGASKPWECQCMTCLKTVAPAFGNVKNGHNGCVYCSKKKVDPSDAVEIAMSKALIPQEPYPGAVVPWSLKCAKCNRFTQTSWTVIAQKSLGAGCSSCTPYGFKPGVPTFLYIISNDTKNAVKVGISNRGAGRLKKHIKNGWEIRHLMQFAEGANARELEQALIKFLRTELSLSPAYYSGDGWTETFPKRSIAIKRVIGLAHEMASAEFRLVKPSDIFLSD